MSDDYEVGFGKPPKRTQFQKGQSGNPKGRPRGSKNFAALLARELDKPIAIKVRGVTKRVSTRQAMAMRIVEKGLQGDLPSIAKVTDFDQRAEAARAQAAPPGPLAQDDQAILGAFLEQHRATAAGGNDDVDA